MYRTLKISILAALALSTSAAQATVILFSNFDSVATPTPTNATTRRVQTADGWTATSPRGIELQFNNVAGRSYSGPALVELDTTGNSAMFHQLGRGHYEVSYFYSPRPRMNAATNGIALFDGARLLDSVTGTGAPATVWQQRSVRFFTLGAPLTFAATGASDGVGGYLDNITISSVAVPEPATWGMLILGFGLIGASARRRRSHMAHVNA